MHGGLLELRRRLLVALGSAGRRSRSEQFPRCSHFGFGRHVRVPQPLFFLVFLVLLSRQTENLFVGETRPVRTPLNRLIPQPVCFLTQPLNSRPVSLALLLVQRPVHPENPVQALRTVDRPVRTVEGVPPDFLRGTPDFTTSKGAHVVVHACGRTAVELHRMLCHALAAIFTVDHLGGADVVVFC